MILNGSTFKTLRDRIMYHRIASRNGYNIKLYNFINQFGWYMFNAQVLEQVKFVTRGQLLKREGEYQLFYRPILNTNIAGTWYNNQGEPLSKSEVSHNYYENNRNIIIM